MDEFADSIVVPVSAFAAFAITTNSLVCGLVWTIRKMRAFCSFLVLSLAMSDLLTGITILVQYNVQLERVSRNIVNLMYNFVFLCGALNLCAVTYERYLAVMKPLQYEALVAMAFKRLVPAIWLLSLAVSALPFTWQGRKTVHKVYIITFLVGISVVCSGFVLITNFRIFRAVRQSIKRENELQLVCLTERNKNGVSLQTAAKKLLAEAKTARLFVVVALVFIVSWFPLVFYSMATVLGRRKAVPESLVHASPFAVVLGSAVNPLIYGLMKTDFRQALQATFCRNLRCLKSHQGEACDEG